MAGSNRLFSKKTKSKLMLSDILVVLSYLPYIILCIVSFLGIRLTGVPWISDGRVDTQFYIFAGFLTHCGFFYDFGPSYGNVLKKTTKNILHKCFLIILYFSCFPIFYFTVCRQKLVIPRYKPRRDIEKKIQLTICKSITVIFFLNLVLAWFMSNAIIMVSFLFFILNYGIMFTLFHAFLWRPKYEKVTKAKNILLLNFILEYNFNFTLPVLLFCFGITTLISFDWDLAVAQKIIFLILIIPFFCLVQVFGTLAIFELLAKKAKITKSYRSPLFHKNNQTLENTDNEMEKQQKGFYSIMREDLVKSKKEEE